jgi:transketolase
VTARVSVEKTSTLGWARYVGRSAIASAWRLSGLRLRLKNCKKKSGFTPEIIILAAKEQIAKAR